MRIKELIRQMREYLNLRPHRGDEQEIVEQINSGITFRGGNLWVLIFAILIASLGLNVNSTAVIIGAMLISPLMGPIIGMGFALGTSDIDMLKRAAKNFIVATGISILTATVYWVLTPISDAQSELLARTSPTLYDVLIAFCGGAAGIIALCTKGKSNVIPGVAIATALMPPLCTAGYGLGTGNLLYFLGAFYLFFINTVFIAMATYGGVRLMHFERKVQLSPERTKRVRRRITTVIVIFLIPAALMTFNIVQHSIFESNLKNFVKNELTQAGTQIISNDVVDGELRIVAVGREIDEQTRERAQSRLADYGLGGYSINVIQGMQSDSVLSVGNKALSLEAAHQQLLELSAHNHQMEEQLGRYREIQSFGRDIERELNVVFPEVERVVSTTTPCDSAGIDAIFAVAIMKKDPKSGKAMPVDRQKLRDWLKARAGVDSVMLVMGEYNPS